MARRFKTAYSTEPYSALATWARRLAVFAVIAAIISIVVVRFGFLEVRPALATFVGALACAAASIIVALAAFVAIWRSGARGLGRIAAALALSLLVLAYPAYLAYQYHQTPAIYDITTDPINPPRFEALARLRTGDDTNPAAYAGLYAAEQQRLAYPDIEPVQLDVPVLRAYEATLTFVTRRRWRIVDARPPQPPRREGHIEAVAQTPLMGLREDVTIRVAPDGDGARIDIRSASRHFNSDLGSNAARIARLIDDLNTVSDDNAAPAAKPPPPAAKTPAKGKK